MRQALGIVIILAVALGLKAGLFQAVSDWLFGGFGKPDSALRAGSAARLSCLGKAGSIHPGGCVPN